MLHTYPHLHNGPSARQDTYCPQFFRPGASDTDERTIESLAREGAITRIHDTFKSQVRELLRIRQPGQRPTEAEMDAQVEAFTAGRSVDDLGVWVYYPWTGNLVHLLDEAEFIELRTARNKYKITAEEQATLGTKRIGVVGLSVGQSVAVTMATERSFGELRLADFDSLELSNLNRIRSGVHELGQLKAINTAREIAELDPFLRVVIFQEGLQPGNMEDFFMGGGKLDLLIEECDSLDIKISSRQMARLLQVPVLMDTSDRGLIDIERFDLEPERPLLHGLVNEAEASNMSQLSNEEKIPIIRRMVNLDAASERLRYSMGEVGKTISTWPQLASAVVTGGGATADVARRILLGSFKGSGRFYFDAEEQISDGAPAFCTAVTPPGN